MLRRSTGCPAEMKRVGVLREKDTWSGSLNWRWVAIARFSMASDWRVGFGEEVGMGGLLEAIERRRLTRGSGVGVSMLKILNCRYQRGLSYLEKVFRW